MPGLLIKNIPPELHSRLRQQAKDHHRSLTQEALTILESGLGSSKTWTPPPPEKSRIPLTEAWLKQAKRRGRA